MRDDLIMAGVDSGDPEAAVQEPSAGAAAILLVEEEDAARVVLAAELRRHGYRVLEASTTAEACDICARSATDIDLLITDVVLSGMTGPGLAQRLVGERPQLRVLFVSVDEGVEVPLKTTHPNVSFLRKPFLAPALLTKVRAVLAGSRMDP